MNVTRGWRTTEDDWVSWSVVLLSAVDRAALAVCAGGCPWAGKVGGVCGLVGCARICRGCEAGWSYVVEGGVARHIGPVKYPASNRWDCNHVKWAGVPQAVLAGTHIYKE